MPLSVDDAFDSDFLDTIVVIRRSQSINAHGRVQLTEKPNTVMAVVLAASPDDLQRLPEAEYNNKAVRITSPGFRLQGPAVDELGNITMPDQILWHGSVFVVVSLDDYSSYGTGFTSALAVSITQPDPPPMPAPLGSA